jgi:hypothetical protein
VGDLALLTQGRLSRRFGKDGGENEKQFNRSRRTTMWGLPKGLPFSCWEQPINQ